MKELILTVVIVLSLASTIMAGSVKGYWKDTNRDGVKDTYVSPYSRSEKNNSIWDNYTTKGNTNPYTGEKGTVDPYKKYFNNK